MRLRLDPSAFTFAAIPVAGVSRFFKQKSSRSLELTKSTFTKAARSGRERMRAGLILLSTGAALGARVMAPAMSKSNLPSKMCVVCNRPFTWRKKWERCWDEVSTCSKRCNGERRALNQRDKKLGTDGEELAAMSIRDPADEAGAGSRSRARAEQRGGASDEAGAGSRSGARAEQRAAASDSNSDGSSDEDEQSQRAGRKAAKKAAKEKRKATRAGLDPTHGQKPCSLCAKGSDLLIRCQTDASGEWRMVCGRCWKLPSVANGVVDGDGSNPLYKYGGLWKNTHASSKGGQAGQPPARAGAAPAEAAVC